ncbi:tetratricopeptide repeat protein [Candidatus Vallotiella sp. (ex Adelges kitamiensis)]|uniref:tetratricopeptide repeat protein n=1 Tax=Candidatus Vallotiella sp. (ex Adelges kitamiensis) TaxID=2864217 RepID=UPI001CE2A6C4|nr:tetratricopeptide repeat protein [Candidatus Vallotia sp. (ex Adelges kitamiensis)]
MNTTRVRIVLAVIVCLARIAFAQLLPAVTDVKQELDATLAKFDDRVFMNPRDVQARFKRANVLVQLGRDDDAITAYTALTQTYPELPEPYNNLAALYAKHGKLEKARALLEIAVHANPGYALSQANLGDLYLRLGAESFKRASELEPCDTYSACRRQQIERLLGLSSLPKIAGSATTRSELLSITMPKKEVLHFPTIVPSANTGPSLLPYRIPKIIQP